MYTQQNNENTLVTTSKRGDVFLRDNEVRNKQTKADKEKTDDS